MNPALWQYQQTSAAGGPLTLVGKWVTEGKRFIFYGFNEQWNASNIERHSTPTRQLSSQPSCGQKPVYRKWHHRCLKPCKAELKAVIRPRSSSTDWWNIRSHVSGEVAAAEAPCFKLRLWLKMVTTIRWMFWLEVGTKHTVRVFSNIWRWRWVSKLGLGFCWRPAVLCDVGTWSLFNSGTLGTDVIQGLKGLFTIKNYPYTSVRKIYWNVQI